MGCAGSTPATKEAGVGIGKCLRSRSISSFAYRATRAVRIRGFLGWGEFGFSRAWEGFQRRNAR
jgi:hypothetical protein